MENREGAPRSSRVRWVAASGTPRPDDSVGRAVAEELVDLLDGVVVEMSDGPSAGPRSDAAPIRRTPGHTSIVARAEGGAAALCAAAGTTRLDALLAEMSAAACRVVDALDPVASFDGMTIGPPMARALRDLLVIEILAGELTRQAGEPDRALDVARQQVTAILAELERIAATTVEGRSSTHGVVIHLDPPRRSPHRYPEQFRQKRVPLLFDGRDAVLVIDREGHAVHEVQRARPERNLSPSELEAARVFAERFGDMDGSLVAAVSSAFGSLGFYVHRDRSIWVCSAGSPLLVMRQERWFAIPSDELADGVGVLAGSATTGRLGVEAAIMLSLCGHGGVIAIADSAEDIAGCVPIKDRVGAAPPTSAERAVHDMLDVDELDTATLVRLASIDGATVLDRGGKLLAYGAVVSSSGSQAEGARTAAARTLSHHVRVVLKVSQDGPIAVFVDGQEVGLLLG